MQKNETTVSLGYLPTPQRADVSDQMRSLGIARYLAWVTLVLVILLTAVLSTYTGKVARETLVSKQKQFSSLLAANLHHQIYRRFTLPTLLYFKAINLKVKEQYTQLGTVVNSTSHGMQIEELYILGEDNIICYSTIEGKEGQRLEDPEVIEAAKADPAQGGEAIMSIKASMPYWQAFFYFPLEQNTFILETTYPLRMQNDTEVAKTGQLVGILRFSRDITHDMENAIRFQQMIILITLFSSALLMGLMLYFIRRAERAMAARMAEEQRLLYELHQNEKLAGMGRVIASIAHEIRNPLGIIRSSAEFLLKRSADSDKISSKISQAIYDEARRLSQTVSDFLDYARPRQSKQEVVDVAQVLGQAFAFLEGELHSRSIEVVKQLPSEPCLVRGDSDLLYRVFYNIIANSMQAMEDNGVLSIIVQSGPDAPGVVEVCFHDTGPGFPEDSISNLLDPFFTTKADGTGLGLPIVSSMLAGQGGALRLSNAQEGGAVVVVTLPAA